ncbi:MAG: sensor histidine kinase, partial [Candidatus Gastranaerophilaceae bacterium]
AGNICINMQNSLKDTQQEDDFVLENKQILRKEKLCLDYDGNKHWYRVLKAPILQNDNSIDGLITIAKNIDNDKAIEHQKDLFIATLVHDLKNPLLAQISGMELLAKGSFTPLNKEQKEILDIIIESANYMKEMLYTLINTYKYDNGNILLKKIKTDLNQLIKTSIKEHLPLAQKNNITLSFNSKLFDENKYIMIDDKQIRRVITNLINNGINYAFNDTEFSISIYEHNNKVIMKFTNCSQPIDKETESHLFEKYIAGSNKYQKVGFGLGMYLSKKVIEAHEGTIYYEGKDTTNSFIIELPKYTENNTNHIKW